MATIGDVLRELLRNTRITTVSRGDLEAAVDGFEAEFERVTRLDPGNQAPASGEMHVPVRIDAQGNITQG